MTENLIPELVGIIAVLVWLLGLTIRTRRFKKNDLHDFGKKMGKLCGIVEQMDKRLTRLEERFDTWIEGKSYK